LIERKDFPEEKKKAPVLASVTNKGENKSHHKKRRPNGARSWPMQ